MVILGTVAAPDIHVFRSPGSPPELTRCHDAPVEARAPNWVAGLTCVAPDG